MIFETELWPNLYHQCGRRKVPLVLASARISSRSVSRYRRLGSLFRDSLRARWVVAAQGEGDASRFVSLGADPERTHVTGNIKFDFSVPHDIGERGRRLREFYAAARPMWVAGSTHGGEEEIVLEAQRIVHGSHPRRAVGPGASAPAEVRGSGSRAAAGWHSVRAAVTARGREAGPSAAAATVLFVDTLGELLDFYAAADVAFVGGSLVPIGGHNLLEPAALGVPIVTGPHNCQ